MNDASQSSHPEELLDLYVLHALDPGEEGQLQVHLDSCAPCRQSLAQKLGVAAMLGQMVEQQPPPAGLQERVMRAVAQRSRGSSTGGAAARQVMTRAPWTRLTMPLAASLFAVVLTASLAVHYFTVNRLKVLEQENLAMAERLTVALAAAAQEREAMGELRAASYMIADPHTYRLGLEPMGENNAAYQGVLLVSEDGQHAMLLLAGMTPPSRTTDYQVWLMRPDKRVAIGAVRVDDTGSATASLTPQESVFGFDWLALSTSQDPESTPSPESLVLRTRITSGGSGR